MSKRIIGNIIRSILRFFLLRSNLRPPKIETQISQVLYKAKKLKAYKANLVKFTCENVDLNVMKFFKQLPITTKQNLKDDPSSFKSNGRSYREVRTGGSTGEPLVFFQDKFSRRAQKRNMYFGRLKWGLSFNQDRCLLLWGHASSFAPGLKGTIQKILLNVKDFCLDRKRISVYDLSVGKVRGIVEAINSHEPDYIQGYASSLETLAILIRSEGLNLEVKNLALIVSTAEPLLESQKEVIEEAFKCKVSNEYGCSEIGVLAYSTPNGEMETVHENIYLEVIDVFERDSSKYGEIVATTLRDSSPILLRYKTGDLARVRQECNDFIIESIIGRNHDLIKLSDGSKIHGEFFTHVLENFDSIDRFQVNQTTIDEITIILKVNNLWSDAQSLLIKKNLNTVLNDRTEINIIFDDFRFEASGKFRWIRSSL